MNSTYFFLPFLLVAGFGIYQDASASETIVGYDYFDINNSDGTRTWVTHEPYVFDGNSWQPFVASGNTVTTASGTVTITSNGTYTITTNGKTIHDMIIAKYADVSNLNSWTYPNTLNNDSPDVSWDGTQFVSSKVKAGVGQLDYKYILNNGKWKTQLEATNLSALTTKAFGFDEIIDIETDSIFFGKQMRNLDNFNGVTFNKTWLNNNQGKVIDFLNDVQFDFDKGFANLHSVTVYDTGVNKSRLVFDYRTSTPLLPNEKLVIDPTFGYTAGTMRGAQRNTACTGAYSSTGASYYAGWDSGVTCLVAGAYWDITSIPDTATITNVNVRYDVLSQTGGANNCIWKSYEGTMSTDSNTAFLEDVYTGGTTFVAADTNCETVANNYVLDLGTSADADLQAELAVDNQWGVGVKGSSVTTDYAQLDGIELEVTYTVVPPPDRINDLTYTNLSTNTLDLLWTQPALNGGNLTNYLINFTTPYGNPQTFKANTTNTYLNVTGLTFGTQYSFRVSALTETGYNATGNILNVTTSTTTYSVAPVLIANSYNTTKIDLIWTAPSMNNINGYKIERENPISTGWSTLVSNTTTTTLYYNNTGLTTNIIYNYRVTAMNGTGFSNTSNEYDMTTYHLPNAVTDLTGTATDFVTVNLSWTAPVSYAPEIEGYRINYTTPEGDPQTIISPDPFTTSVTATVPNLQVGVEYSFRVAPITVHGTNATGNILNLTTATIYNLGDLESGQETNTDDFQIFFSRDDINSTAIQLDVTYSDTYDLNCYMYYQLARINTTYTNLTSTVASSDEVMSSFLFINATGDIIHVKCWDTITDDEARYVITITDFEFIDQIENLRNGTYGTYFQIGAIDGVTLMICILAMIGFNRTNPIGGIVFLVITVGTLSYFEIITYPVIMYPALALLMVWGYISTRKDD